MRRFGIKTSYSIVSLKWSFATVLAKYAAIVLPLVCKSQIWQIMCEIVNHRALKGKQLNLATEKNNVIRMYFMKTRRIWRKQKVLKELCNLYRGMPTNIDTAVDFLINQIIILLVIFLSVYHLSGTTLNKFIQITYPKIPQNLPPIQQYF